MYNPGPFSTKLLPSRSAPACADAGVYAFPGVGPAFAFNEFQRALLCPTLQPVNILLESSQHSGVLASPPSSVLSMSLLLTRPLLLHPSQ